jgi:hypothetical protein
MSQVIACNFSAKGPQGSKFSPAFNQLNRWSTSGRLEVIFLFRAPFSHAAAVNA